jgi:hypothetical protein
MEQGGAASGGTMSSMSPVGAKVRRRRAAGGGTALSAPPRAPTPTPPRPRPSRQPPRPPPPRPPQGAAAGTTFATEPAGAATYGPGVTGAPQVYRDPPLGSSTFEPFHHPVNALGGAAGGAAGVMAGLAGARCFGPLLPYTPGGRDAPHPASSGPGSCSPRPAPAGAHHGHPRDLPVAGAQGYWIARGPHHGRGAHGHRARLGLHQLPARLPQGAGARRRWLDGWMAWEQGGCSGRVLGPPPATLRCAAPACNKLRNPAGVAHAAVALAAGVLHRAADRLLLLLLRRAPLVRAHAVRLAGAAGARQPGGQVREGGGGWVQAAGCTRLCQAGTWSLQAGCCPWPPHSHHATTSRSDQARLAAPVGRRAAVPRRLSWRVQLEAWAATHCPLPRPPPPATHPGTPSRATLPRSARRATPGAPPGGAP